MAANDPIKDNKPGKKPEKKVQPQRRRRVEQKVKSEERRILEQLEGEDFDTTDFRLLTDWSDDEPF